jgi:hypothetical protein
MDFETYFFRSMKMSSHELFEELMRRLPETKPVSWPGLAWDYVEHPSNIDQLVMEEMGQEFEIKYRHLEQKYDRTREKSQESYDDYCDLENELESLRNQLKKMDSDANSVREKWNVEISAQVRFRQAWSTYVYNVLHVQNEIEEKALILKLSNELAQQAKKGGRKVTQTAAKALIKEAKTNGFHIPFAWSICYANARLIFSGVRVYER